MRPFEAFLKSHLDHGAAYSLDSNKNVRIEARLPKSLAVAVRSWRDEIREILLIEHIVVRTPLVRSGVVIWVRSDADRLALIRLGAAPGLVYTAKELEALATAKARGMSVEELIQAKNDFDGQILDDDPDKS